jgi:hypothetical protein
MNFKKVELGLIGKILAVCIAINIIGDIGNVVFWWVNPESRGLSLNTGYLGVTSGVDSALTVGTVILLIVSLAYVVALFGVVRRVAWMPLLVVSVSIVNRGLALLLYAFSAAFLFWTVWTVILVVLSCLVWRRLDKPLAKLWGSGVSSQTNN